MIDSQAGIKLVEDIRLPWHPADVDVHHRGGDGASDHGGIDTHSSKRAVLTLNTPRLLTGGVAEYVCTPKCDVAVDGI